MSLYEWWPLGFKVLAEGDRAIEPPVKPTGRSGSLRAGRHAALGRGIQPRALAHAPRAGRGGCGAGIVSASIRVVRTVPWERSAGVAAYHRSQYLLHAAAAGSPAALGRLAG